jgi:hypothetical protein
MCTPKGGAPEGVSLRVFSNLRRTYKYRNLPLHKQLFFYFHTSFPSHTKEIFPWEHGNMGTYKLGEIPENTHRNKKGVVYITQKSAIYPSRSYRNQYMERKRVSYWMKN